MKMKTALVFVALLGLPFLVAGEKLSGEVVNGYRVLDMKGKQSELSFTVYRGDYIKFDHSQESAHFILPDLKIDKLLPSSMKDAPYFKMKKSGSYAYSVGDVKGMIYVIEYHGTGYKELTAEQSQAFIEKSKPLILDVRTKGEFMRVHIDGATLLPVQQLQTRAVELEKYKNQDILIYCATGNRSTVASKILIDRGFKSISNMRYGIKDWMGKKKPVVK